MKKILYKKFEFFYEDSLQESKIYGLYNGINLYINRILIEIKREYTLTKGKSKE